MHEQHSQPIRALLTVEEVADLLRIPVKTLYSQRYRQVSPGVLGIRVGRYLRFEPGVLSDWIAAQSVKESV